MKLPLALLAASALALGGAMASRALPPPKVNDTLIAGDSLPKELANFGFFLDVSARERSPGVIGYELRTPLYSDMADKLRYVYIPEGTRVVADGDGLLQFPVGSAIIKTFAFGEGAEQRYIETRVLLHRADGWVALPYRWNEDQTTATLALAGARLPVTTPEGEEISYRIPNKNQCKTCHSKDGEVIPIGPKVRNLPGIFFRSLGEGGRIERFPETTDPLPVWTERGSIDDTEALARAYLDVNCAHCHQPGGGASNSGLDLRWEQDDPHKLGIRKPPVAAGRGAGGHLVSIAPGDPDASILVYRMDSAEPGIAMPELGKSTIDHDGVAVVRRWIEEMDERPGAP
ncbi:SO2930 family diheme c-type cytochrome [Erythrobacter sp. GH1-10]|uniref:SO2930 family diheme c-type cytochrome n=1 Tax=Erythrobacter sp. GH1-10 TaxID=3349334 RepID=UPI0038783B14